MREFRHRLLLYGLLASILLIIGLVYWYACFRASTLENFEQQNSLQLKPDCKVYYTSRVQACDNPGTVTENDVLIDYRYHKSHYEKLKEELDAKKETSSDKYLTILSILQDYSDFPDGQSCKVTVPGWQQVTGLQETALLGDKHAGQRGNPQHWAFCVNEDRNDPIFYDSTGLLFEKKADGSYDTVRKDGKTYARGAFPDFKAETLTKLFCQNTLSEPTPSFTGLRIDPYTNEIVYVVNHSVSPISEDTVNRLVKNGMCEEAIVDAVHDGINVQELRLVAKTAQLPIIKFDENLCKSILISPVQASLPLMFELPIAPVKIIPKNSANHAHLLGTTDEMEERKNELLQEKQSLLSTIQSMNPPNNTRESVYNYVYNRIAELERKNEKDRKQMESLNKGNKAAISALAAGFFGAFALLTVTIILQRIRARIRKRIDGRKKELFWLKTNFNSIDCNNPTNEIKSLFGFKKKRAESKKRRKRRNKRRDSYIAECISYQTSSRTANLCLQSNASCPSNLPIMKSLYEEVKPFIERLHDIDRKMDDITKEVERIRSQFVEIVQGTMVSKKLILSNVPYHAVSYDRKLYIPLP